MLGLQLSFRLAPLLAGLTTGLTTGLAGLALAGHAPAAQELDRIPGEADGRLEAAIDEALRGRDTVDPSWRGEAGVADWTGRLRALLDGELEAPDGHTVRFVDRRATGWQPRYARGRLSVEERPPSDDGAAEDAQTLPLGALVDVLGEYATVPEEGAAPDARRIGIKIVGVELDEAGPWTLVRAARHDARGMEQVQSLARWRVQWSPGAPGESLPLALEWEREERATLRAAAPGFVDCTASAFAGRVPEACTLGLDTWRRRLDSLLGTGLLGHQGLALGDVDGDGREDVYLCQPGGLPNRLFLSDAEGALVDVSARSGVNYLDRTSSALLLHLDDDPHVDLALATTTEILVHAGAGDGTFELRGRFPASTTTSMCAADFDLDGDLDLYVCGYVSPYNDTATPLPYHDANNGERNQLLRNDGELAFVDATDEVGLDVNNRRFSFAASWADHDRDGDPDLYVANDFGRNNLYRNDGGTFVDVAAELGVEDIAAGMGVAWGDVDNDGWDDLYVSNMFSAAGSRIAYEPVFHASADETARGALQRHARGNTLFRNLAGERFEDVTAAAGVGMGRWAWGSVLFDMNDDGWLDALVPNGMITGDRADDL